MALLARHRVHRHHPAQDTLGLLGEPAIDANRRPYLFPRLPDRLAVLLGQQFAQSGFVRLHRVGDAKQDRRTFVGRHPGHGLFTPLSRLERCLSILQISLRHPVNDFTGAGVVHLSPATVGCLPIGYQ